MIYNKECVVTTDNGSEYMATLMEIKVPGDRFYAILLDDFGRFRVVSLYHVRLLDNSDKIEVDWESDK